jgi:hypothetical protein
MDRNDPAQRSLEAQGQERLQNSRGQALRVHGASTGGPSREVRGCGWERQVQSQVGQYHLKLHHTE